MPSDSKELTTQLVAKMIECGMFRQTGANTQEITKNHVNDVCSAFKEIYKAVKAPEN